MKAKLVSPVASPPDWEIELEQFPVVIGRSPHAEIQPLDSTVSDQHCEIEQIKGRLMVRDLGSECGTFVNDVPVDIAPLLPGDKLTVGKSTFVASYDPPRRESLPVMPLREFNDGPLWESEFGGQVTFMDLVNLLDRQRRRYRQPYHGEPWQAEALFPDPPHPEHLEHLLVEEMKEAGVDPRFIFAFEQTGVLVTEFNFDAISQQQLAQWQTAVEAFEARHAAADTGQRYPVGAITMYGPDKANTTMIVAAVMADEASEPIYRRWVCSGVKNDAQVQQQMKEFFLAHGVQSVIHVRENIGCPHREGLDYPVGEDCPFCPYWKGREQGRQ